MTAVFAVAAAITFTPLVTFAESGIDPAVSCTNETVTTCSDASVLEACNCNAGECACTSSRCSSDGSSIEALVCTPIVTCAQYATAPCDGKSEGASCLESPDASTGTCALIDCPTLIDGVYTTDHKLACRAPFNDGEVPGTTGGFGDDMGEGTSEGSRSKRPSTATTSKTPDAGSSNTDSGCNAVPETSNASGLITGVPLGLLAFVAFRRRRRARV